MLLSEGHARAARYPLWMLWMESEIAAVRINQQAVTQALLVQAAVGSLLDKKGAKHFKELVESLTDG